MGVWRRYRRLNSGRIWMRGCDSGNEVARIAKE